MNIQRSMCPSSPRVLCVSVSAWAVRAHRPGPRASLGASHSHCQSQFIYLSSTKKRTMTSKTRTWLAFYLLSWLITSFLPFHVLLFEKNLSPTAVRTAPALLHVPSHSGLGTSAFLFLFLPLFTCMNQFIHPQSFTGIMLYNSQIAISSEQGCFLL